MNPMFGPESAKVFFTTNIPMCFLSFAIRFRRGGGPLLWFFITTNREN